MGRLSNLGSCSALALYARYRVQLMFAGLRYRWLGFRLRKIFGVNLVAVFDRADAGQRRAHDRALLIDPADQQAANRAGAQARMEILRKCKLES